MTSTLTTVFTAFTSFGLVAVSTWFASERWIFLRHRGQKWLSDALMEYGDTLMNLPGVERTRQTFHAFSQLLTQAHDAMGRIASKALRRLRTRSRKPAESDLEANIPPTVHVHAPNERPPMVRHVSDGEKSMSTDPRRGLSISVTGLQKDRLCDAPQTPITPSSPGKQLWLNAFRSVKMHSAISAPFGVMVSPHEPHRQRTSSSDLTASSRKRTNPGEPVRAVFRSRLAALIPKLKELETTQDLAAHQALVRHLEFSPDGRYLATSR